MWICGYNNKGDGFCVCGTQQTAVVTALPAGGFVNPPPTHVTPIAIANGVANTSPVSGTRVVAVSQLSL